MEKISFAWHQCYIDANRNVFLFWGLILKVREVIEKRMRLQILKNLITYAILIFYLCTPMLDSIVCADCMGNAPFRGEATISHTQTLHVDVSYSKKGETHSNTTTEQGQKSFCSICANVLLGVEIYSPQVHILLAESYGTHIATPLSELHYSIHKPPPNFLA